MTTETVPTTPSPETDKDFQYRRLQRPDTREDLWQWIEAFTTIHLPETPICPHHNTPLDYLAHAFFESASETDAVVWACRGGGKTMIGAVATLLDMLFKPGIQIRILGGSKDQSSRMYTY